MQNLSQRNGSDGNESDGGAIDAALQDAQQGGHDSVAHKKNLLDSVLGDGLIRTSNNKKAFIGSAIFGLVMCVIDSFVSWFFPCMIDTAFLCK